MTKVFCDNRECFNRGTAVCKAEEIWHTPDGFCTAYKRKEVVPMGTFNNGCSATCKGYKSKGIKVMK